MARKKIVFVIVEGPSDETSLGIALSQVYDRDSVYIKIMHCDITTKKGVNSQNIIAKLGETVKEYAKSNHYTAKDFKEIVHIVDTDGVYIPDKNIYEENECKDPKYTKEGIYTNNVHGVVERNMQKRYNLLKLRSQNYIWKVPYSIYYMSCNLDHVLYNQQNSTGHFLYKKVTKTHGNI